jgi:hypothetical protein
MAAQAGTAIANYGWLSAGTNWYCLWSCVCLCLQGCNAKGLCGDAVIVQLCALLTPALKTVDTHRPCLNPYAGHWL